jgi:hypothetical protein
MGSQRLSAPVAFQVAGNGKKHNRVITVFWSKNGSILLIKEEMMSINITLKIFGRGYAL